MSARVRPAAATTHAVAAIITLDPAGVGPCGLAARWTSPLRSKMERGRLRAPDFVFEGSVFETRMHDDLAVQLALHVPSDGCVLLAVENSIYGARTTARHIGRAIGCIESVLQDLNLARAEDTQYVVPSAFRNFHWPDPAARPEGRDAWKDAAVELVGTLYGLQCGHDQAEAVLLNDYVVCKRADWWSRGRYGKKDEAA